MALPAPHLPFAIPAGIGSLGGFMTLAATRLGRKVAPVSAVPRRRAVPRGSTGTGRSREITSTMSIPKRDRDRVDHASPSTGARGDDRRRANFGQKGSTAGFVKSVSMIDRAVEANPGSSAASRNTTPAACLW